MTEDADMDHVAQGHQNWIADAIGIPRYGSCGTVPGCSRRPPASPLQSAYPDMDHVARDYLVPRAKRMVESGCVPLNATLFHLFNKKNANQYIAIKSYIPPCRLSINDSSMAAKRWWMASQGFGARKSNVARRGGVGLRRSDSGLVG